MAGAAGVFILSELGGKGPLFSKDVEGGGLGLVNCGKGKG